MWTGLFIVLRGGVRCRAGSLGVAGSGVGAGSAGSADHELSRCSRDRGLTQRFGGLAAVNDVSLELWHGRIHAVIGPNGAGKSTLINLLSGDLAAHARPRPLGGDDITALQRRTALARRHRAQLPEDQHLPPFTVFENCRLAAQSRAPRAVAACSRRRPLPRDREAAERALELAGLAGSAAPRRRDALARRAAPARDRDGARDRPRGAAARRAARRDGRRGGASGWCSCCGGSKPAHAILLVEHDMDAVFALADVITVMVKGQVLESGRPRRSARARRARAYLGEDGAGGPAGPSSARATREGRP